MKISMNSASRIFAPACVSRRQEGFTLLEMLVVILVIAMLTGIVGPRLLNQVSRSEVTTAKAQMDAISKALQAYRLDTGHFPSTQDGLSALTNAPTDDPRWKGPYLQDAVPADPWGTPFQYANPSLRGKDFDLYSLGHDRKVGGSGDDSDLYY